MSWNQLPEHRRNQITQELTPLQLKVLQHRLDGHSWRTIGLALGIHEATARGHHHAAIQRLRHALERKDAA